MPIRTAPISTAPISTTTPPQRAVWPPPSGSPTVGVDDSWTAWTIATIASIWAAVVLISVFSPDLVSGSEHQHLPVAAFSTWIWGVGASVASLVSFSRLRGDVARRPVWLALSGATMALWTVATLVSIFAPTMETGSDPTTIPVAAMIAPVTATLGTALAGVVVLVVARLGRGVG